MLTTRPAHRLFLRMLGLTTGLLAVPSALHAQTAAPPAHVAFAERPATIESAGVSDVLGSGVPLTADDRVRTTDGRLEVFLGDGTTVYIDERSIVAWRSPASVRLSAGAVTVDLASTDGPGAEAFEVVTLAASIRLTEQGQYRIAAGDTRPTAPPEDGLTAWTRARGAAREAPGDGSRRYLPPEVRAYAAAFDRAGRWDALAPGGPVWRPTVTPDWRPYYNGTWKWLPSYGWTWIDDAEWGWATHHYGRWGLDTDGRWFWIPDRAWGPAWVTWAMAPGFVSWSATGADDGPVIPFPGQARFVNGRVFARDFVVNDRVFDADFAWTTVPSHALGAPERVSDTAVPTRRLVERDNVPFIQRRQAPRGPHAGPAEPSAWLSTPSQPWLTRAAAPPPPPPPAPGRSGPSVGYAASAAAAPGSIWWAGGHGWHSPAAHHPTMSRPSTERPARPGIDRNAPQPAPSPPVRGRVDAGPPPPEAQPSSAGWGSSRSTGHRDGPSPWGRSSRQD